MPILINFNIRKLGVWRTAYSILVDGSDMSEIERMAKKYMRKQFILFDHELYPLILAGCFQAAIKNGRNTIYLIAEREIDIRKGTVPLMPEPRSEDETESEGKRGRR